MRLEDRQNYVGSDDGLAAPFCRLTIEMELRDNPEKGRSTTLPPAKVSSQELRLLDAQSAFVLCYPQKRKKSSIVISYIFFLQPCYVWAPRDPAEA